MDQLCSVMPSNRTRDNGEKTETLKFHLNMRKNITERLTKHWNRLS